MSDRILAAIRSQPWAIVPGYLEAIEAMALRMMDHPAVAQVAGDGHEERHFSALAVMGERVSGTRSAMIRDGVASLPFFGPVLPRAAMVSPSGAGAVALDQMAADFRALDTSPAVRTILMVYDSPGGAVTQVREFAQMVAAASKPVVAHVTGMCCSAAYWVAAPSKEIVLDPTGIVGSIGVLMGGSVQEGPDMSGRRDVAVASSNAPNKRPDLATEEGQALVRAMIDEIEEVFIADVARGRGTTPATVKAEFGAGGTKTGRQAKAAGMVDRIEAGGLEGTIQRLAARAAPRTTPRRAAAAQVELARIRASSLTGE